MPDVAGDIAFAEYFVRSTEYSVLPTLNGGDGTVRDTPLRGGCLFFRPSKLETPRQRSVSRIFSARHPRWLISSSSVLLRGLSRPAPFSSSRPAWRMEGRSTQQPSLRPHALCCARSHPRAGGDRRGCHS